MAELTKEAMANAVMDILEVKGPDRITIKEITDRCGLTRNTFYYHFHDIHELLRWVLSSQAEKIMEKYIKEEDWRGGLEEALSFLYDHKKMIKHIYGSISYDALIAFVNDALYGHAKAVVALEAKNLGLESTKAIELAADFYTNAMVGAVITWIREDMPQTPKKVSKTYNEMFKGTIESALISAQRAVPAR